MTMKIDFDKIIIKVKIITEGKLKAIVGVDFGDFVVKGFRIQESQYENAKGQKLWLSPPCYQSGGRYRPMFFAPEKAVWEALEAKIWDAYDAQSKETYKKMYDLKDEDLKQF